MYIHSGVFKSLADVQCLAHTPPPTTHTRAHSHTAQLYIPSYLYRKVHSTAFLLIPSTYIHTLLQFVQVGQYKSSFTFYFMFCIFHPCFLICTPTHTHRNHRYGRQLNCWIQQFSIPSKFMLYPFVFTGMSYWRTQTRAKQTDQKAVCLWLQSFVVCCNRMWSPTAPHTPQYIVIISHHAYIQLSQL